MKKTTRIDSENNPTFRLFLKLTKSRGIKKHGLSIMSRSKHVREVVKTFPERCEGLIFSDLHEPPSESVPPHVRYFHLKPTLFRRIDIHSTGQPLLLVRFSPFRKWTDSSETNGCTLCIPFQDPANVGAAIRTAAAFDVTRIVLLKEAAPPFHFKSIRVAGSTVFRVSLFEGPSLDELTVSKIPLITLSPEGRDICDFKFPSSFCLLPGLEGTGLPVLRSRTTRLSIPMAHGVDSLNAVMATGISLYLWKEQNRSGAKQGKKSA